MAPTQRQPVQQALLSSPRGLASGTWYDGCLEGSENEDKHEDHQEDRQPKNRLN